MSGRISTGSAIDVIELLLAEVGPEAIESVKLLIARLENDNVNAPLEPQVAADTQELAAELTKPVGS